MHKEKGLPNEKLYNIKKKVQKGNRSTDNGDDYKAIRTMSEREKIASIQIH